MDFNALQQMRQTLSGFASLKALEKPGCAKLN
jgi:hypothetical protein